MWHSFCVDRPGLSQIKFFVDRPSLDAVGDLEYPFFSQTSSLERHSKSLARLLLDPSEDAPESIVVCVRNPAIVFDLGFIGRVEAAVATLDRLGGHWSTASPHGLSRNGEVLSSIYSSVTPTLPAVRTPQPLVDIAVDLVLINGAFLAELRAADFEFDDACFEQALVVEGYLSGRVAVFLPEFAVPLDGPLMPWKGPAAAEALRRAFTARLGDQTIPTLFGPIRFGDTGGASTPESTAEPFSDIVSRAIGRHCSPLSLSIVTRTRFNRPHLLHRMLTSVTRSRIEGAKIEVVLSTDIAAREAQEQFRELKKMFPAVDLRLKVNQGHQHSRIGNLVGGVAAATNDFVAFVDDDDYVDLMAFGEIALATFMGAQPLIFMTNTLHEEEWSATPSGRQVLSRTTVRQSYPANGWRGLFFGVNQLPISALIVPRDVLRRRLDVFVFRHDLSEDYILVLLILTDPSLPSIEEIAPTFVHISSRPGQDNTITMTDRRPWVRDISAFLADLLGSAAVAGPGVWQLLRGVAEQGRGHRDDAARRSLQEVILKQRKDIALLSGEIRRLTDLLGSQD